MPMADGEKAAKAIDSNCFAPAAEYSVANGLGGAWACWPAATRRAAVLQKGIEWLIENQTADGTWSETLSTGTGFPKVFYLSYHLYRNSFPLLALSEFLKARKQLAGSTAVGRQVKAGEYSGETCFGDWRDGVRRLARCKVIDGTRRYSPRSGS